MLKVSVKFEAKLYVYKKRDRSAVKWEILPALAVRSHTNLSRPQSNIFFFCKLYILFFKEPEIQPSVIILVSLLSSNLLLCYVKLVLSY